MTKLKLDNNEPVQEEKARYASCLEFLHAIHQTNTPEDEETASIIDDMRIAVDNLDNRKLQPKTRQTLRKVIQTRITSLLSNRAHLRLMQEAKVA